MSRTELMIKMKNILEEVYTQPDIYLLLCKTLRLAETYEFLSTDIIIKLSNLFLPDEFRIEDKK